MPVLINCVSVNTSRIATLFSRPCEMLREVGTFWTTKHTIRYFKAEIIEHSEVQLEIGIRRGSGNPPNTWKLNNTVLSTTGGQEELSRVSGRYCEINKHENTNWGQSWQASGTELIS